MLQDCLGNTYDFILKTNPRPLGPHQQEEVYEIYISPMKAMFFITCCCCCSVAESCLTLCNPMDCSLLGSCPWDFPGKNTVVGCHFLLQGSSWPRDWTFGSCIGRWVLYQWDNSEDVIVSYSYFIEERGKANSVCLVPLANAPEPNSGVFDSKAQTFPNTLYSPIIVPSSELFTISVFSYSFSATLCKW